MKRYVNPTLECVEFKVEEKLASTCTGSCVRDMTMVIGGVTYSFTALTYSS